MPCGRIIPITPLFEHSLINFSRKRISIACEEVHFPNSKFFQNIPLNPSYFEENGGLPVKKCALLF